MSPPALHRFEAAGLGKAPFSVEGMIVSKWQACPGAPVQAGSSCDYCGQSIMYVFTIRGADGRRFKVGCDCVLKTGDAGIINRTKQIRASHSRELARARAERSRQAKRRTREEAARARRRQTRAAANAFAKAHGLIEAFKVAARGPKGELAREFLGRLRANGSLSPAQVRLLQQLATRLEPAPSGRVTFAGAIEGIKAREGVHGWVYKMTVLADAGFRVWLTAPRSLLAAGAPGDRYLEQFRGRRVTLTATLEPSREEPGFAFGSRPRLVLEASAETAPSVTIS